MSPYTRKMKIGTMKTKYVLDSEHNVNKNNPEKILAFEGGNRIFKNLDFKIISSILGAEIVFFQRTHSP